MLFSYPDLQTFIGKIIVAYILSTFISIPDKSSNTFPFIACYNLLIIAQTKNPAIWRGFLL